MTGGAWMSEQSETSGHGERIQESKRRSLAPLIAALLVMLALGVGGGYLLGASRGEGDSDASQTTTPAEPGSQDSTQPTRPVAVATPGAALAPLSGPPEGTMAMLETSTVDADATYAVTFSPFGYGPGQAGSSLVVRIETATPQNASARGFDMGGRNVLATLAGGDTDVAKGGVYSGVLGFRTQGNLLSPVLRDIKPVE